MKLEIAERAHEDAKARRAEAARSLASVTEETTPEALVELENEFTEAEGDVERTAKDLDLAKRVNAAIEAAPAPVAEPTPIVVTRNEPVYRKDKAETSYFGDLYHAMRYQSRQAFDRLDANNRHFQDELAKRGESMETRSPVDATAGAGFNPPIWMADEWAALARPGRPVADRVQKLPMPTDGLTAHIPKVSTGTTVAVQAAEGDNVSSTNISSTTADASLVTIAGQQDVDRQILERSLPGLDMVLFDDLMRAYDSQLDTQLLSGTGSNGQHLGIRAVSGVNTVTYDDASPTGSELLNAVYGAISQIYSNRYFAPTAIYMHPRRATWLAATQASTFPLFQQGGLFQAAGTQDDGKVGTFAGLPVIIDANIGTTYGASTNQDEVYVVYEPDFRLAEGPLRQATYEDVLSGQLAVRLQLFAFSFFWANRYAKSIAIVSGTGLVAPSGF